MAIIKEIGTIAHMSEVQSGMSQNGNPWYRQTIVVDVAGYNGSYRKVALQATGNVVGDLDIEIKIDRSGSVRLNIFSHSADQYTNYLDNSQRNGVGLTYQTEFNNFGQFVRNIFRSKAKRQEVRQAEEEALLNAERVEIRITKENDGKQQR